MKATEDKKELRRDLYADVFRCILMIMIVAHHNIVHGLKLTDLRSGAAPNGYCTSGILLLNCFLVVAVNCFFWISGFYRIKFSLRKIVKLFLECCFYILAINICFFIYNGNLSYAAVLNLLKAGIYPLHTYWFMTAYLAVCILAPFLNRLAESLSPREQGQLVLALGIINTIYGFHYNIGGVGDGYTVCQGIYLYLIGRCCFVNYDLIRGKINRAFSLGLYVFFSLVTGFCVYKYKSQGAYALAWKMYSYNNPAVVLAAVSLCMSCVKIRKPCAGLVRAISRMSRYSLAVYLISDYPAVRGIVFNPMLSMIPHVPSGFFFVLLLIALNAVIIFTGCILIDFLCQNIFNIFIFNILMRAAGSIMRQIRK